MLGFGSGVLVATGLVDANGNTIAQTTPSPFGILQGVTLEFDFETKPLYGENSFPVAVGRGQGKVTGKATSANIFAALFNSVFFGQTLVSGLFATSKSSVGVAIPTTPWQITPTVPSSGTWTDDMGVTDSSGRIMQRVAASPATGQYTAVAGQYTFAAADNVSALSVFINFRYTASVTGAQKSSIANLPMGYAPSTQIDLSMSYAGKSLSWRLPNVISPKLSIDFKNNDWSIPNYEFEAFADASNNIAYYSASV